MSAGTMIALLCLVGLPAAAVAGFWVGRLVGLYQERNRPCSNPYLWDGRGRRVMISPRTRVDA